MGRNVVEPAWLWERRDDPAVRVVDCRFDLADPERGRREYGRAHIPGAVYFHLEEDLSGPAGARGGRHPLPDLEELSEKLGRAGIDAGVTVVAYDDQKGSMAARLWWLLRFLGHSQVALLDGGYPGWLEAGFPVTAEPARPAPRIFRPSVRWQMVAGVDEVRRCVETGGGTLVDSRAPERYRGEHEPLDPKAGHIPGARNFPWNENLDEHGRLLPPERLRERFAALPRSPAPIVYCGSGVTACVNLLALEEAGFPDVRLYVGSWSDWCSYPENPVATGDE